MISLPKKCKIYEQKCKYYTEEQLLKFFKAAPQKVDGVAEEYIMYENDSESGFIGDGNSLRFSTNSGQLYETVFGVLSDTLSEELDDKGILDFATRDEVLNKLKKVMKDDYNIEPDEWSANKFYAVKKESVDSYKETVYQRANESVDNSDALAQEKAADEAERIKNIPSEDFYSLI